MRFDPILWRKLSITAFLLLLFRFALSIPLPGLDVGALRMIFSEGWGQYPGLSGAVTPIIPPTFSVLALGIWPYIAGSFLALVLSGLFPALRKLREGSLGDHRTFDGLILLVTLLIAVIQSYGIGQYLSGMEDQFPVLAVSDQTLFMLLVMTTLTAGTMACIWVAHLITRHGLGNGVVLMLIVMWLARLPRGIGEQIVLWRAENRPMGHWVLLGAFTLAVFLWAVTLVRARRELTALSTQDPPGEPVRIPLRVNLTGTIPIIAAGQFLNLFYTVVGPGAAAALAWRHSVWYWIINCVLIIVLTYLISAWVLNVRGLLAILHRWGFALDVDDPDETAARRIEARLGGPILLMALTLCLFAGLPLLLSVQFGFAHEMALLYGHFPLVIAAVALDLRGTLGRYRVARGPAEVPGGAPEDEWVVLTGCETELEVELIRRRLSEAGIDSDWEINRVIPITGTLAPWEVCPPSRPSLVIHRRLGGGLARVLVAESDVDRARAHLATFEAAGS